VYRFFQLSILILLLSKGLFAQLDTISIVQTSFRQGRNLIGISGTISSTNIENTRNFTSPDQFGNLYRFDVKLGKFVANKNLLGILFIASSNPSFGYVKSKIEILGVGPWYRLYLGKQPNIAFFLQSSLRYSSYVGSTSGVQGFTTINQESEAKGITGSIGLGVCYVIADRISFEVGCDYNKARFWGTLRDNVLVTKHDITFDRSEYLFSFGFTILFGKLKGDE